MDSIGVAVIGAGMAGRAHASGYRSAGTVYGLDRPALRLVAISDLNPALAEDTRRRYGFERVEPDWRALLDAGDVQAVSVVVANQLHREMLEALLAAGKHVLCEKPLAPSVVDGRAMVAAAARADRVAVVGYTYRRSPAISAIRGELAAGRLGEVVHFNGHGWYDYAIDPLTPMTWRYRGGPGTGVLADTGSHLLDTAEYLCGPVVSVSGGAFSTVIPRRPVPAGPTIGHARAELTGEYEPVENEDIATFTARFAGGALGTFSLSRIAHGLPNGLAFEVFGTGGSAAFDLQRAAEFTISDASAEGHRRVFTGPAHPYLRGGLPMDAPGQGHGVADLFTYQARSFVDQIAGVKELPPCATLEEGVRGLEVIEAVITSARSGGAAVPVGSR
ncbi:putative dehydrogenase [Amycolatopsis bartoniae]|uniref:Dehydrogenase n=1 Tax=Amycolatopsis bartoniae TaxID=941986 RepID=A0A8H9ITP9_9PSEU|nr:Gfo/Idh/MocA family oxidoreductase [Amycolatopsis bartoniae]MBB2937792.1 putative dehydrogenase [Amycolatopsis bartoniae]TVT06538.1 Gfo/Idh/MocA family oxidoreductase [Amycolatopsis bartoniae]GHF40739.1 dehydrogenase [Amycolatopsis bartoniae]